MLGENPSTVVVPGSEMSRGEEGEEGGGKQEMLKDGVCVVQSESSGGHQEKVTCLSPASAVKLSASHSVGRISRHTCVYVGL